MIAGGIVEINGYLDQTESEHLRVKIRIGLRISGHRGDVMNPVKATVHDDPSMLEAPPA